MIIQMRKNIMKFSAELHGLLGILDNTKETYPHLKLYTISREWLRHDNVNVIKFKGEKGDLIIELI